MRFLHALIAGLFSYAVAGVLVLVLINMTGCSKKLQKTPETLDFAVVEEKAPEPAPKPEVAPEAPVEPVAAPESPVVVVYFGFDDAKLLPQEAMKLDHLLGGAGDLELRGHACTWGTNDYNMGLSIERANTVAAYLGRGLVLGFGEELCGAACETIYEAECGACRKVEVWKK